VSLYGSKEKFLRREKQLFAHSPNSAATWTCLVFPSPKVSWALYVSKVVGSISLGVGCVVVWLSLDAQDQLHWVDLGLPMG
jgi:hypothetical protein